MSVLLGHGVQSTAVLEPFNLTGIESMRQFTIPFLSIFGVYFHDQRLADFKARDEQVDLVVGIDLVVVFWIGKSKRKHALFLQIGFVDTGEASSNYGDTAEVSRFEGSMLARRAFPIIPITLAFC